MPYSKIVDDARAQTKAQIDSYMCQSLASTSVSITPILPVVLQVPFWVDLWMNRADEIHAAPFWYIILSFMTIASSSSLKYCIQSHVHSLEIST